jgi:two-component system response regulator PilR (NtrC family)
VGNDNRLLALVVDDEETIREFLAEILGGMGFGVDCASRGEEAVEKIWSESYDLVLTDIRMPGLDGMKVLETARSCSPETAVIVITGFGSIAGAVEAMKLGAIDYLSKPFSADAVDVVIHKALELQRLRDENRSLRSQLVQSHRYEDLVGKSNSMQQVFELIETMAQSRATVSFLVVAILSGYSYFIVLSLDVVSITTFLRALAMPITGRLYNLLIVNIL